MATRRWFLAAGTCTAATAFAGQCGAGLLDFESHAPTVATPTWLAEPLNAGNIEREFRLAAGHWRAVSWRSNGYWLRIVDGGAALESLFTGEQFFDPLDLHSGAAHILLTQACGDLAVAELYGELGITAIR